MIGVTPQELSDAIEQPPVIVSENPHYVCAAFFDEKAFTPDFLLNAKFNHTVRPAAKRRMNAATLLYSIAQYFGRASKLGGPFAEGKNFQ
jgi:hypothetical protein